MTVGDTRVAPLLLLRRATRARGAGSSPRTVGEIRVTAARATTRMAMRVTVVYRITSSACISTDSGIRIPSAFAVRKLTTIRNRLL